MQSKREISKILYRSLWMSRQQGLGSIWAGTCCWEHKPCHLIITRPGFQSQSNHTISSATNFFFQQIYKLNVKESFIRSRHNKGNSMTSLPMINA